MNHEDWGFECSMCGKPMSYRFCGMCTSCEQVDNDVPEIGFMTYSFNGLCPQCGSEIKEELTGGRCGEHFQYCEDKNCGWTSVNLYDC